MSYPLFSYKIGKFADMIGVSYQTLQRWDREGILKAHRTPTNRRYYTYQQYMKIQTEFTTVSSAYKNLRDRIDELEKRIAELPNYEAVAPTITCLYYN